MDTNIEGGAFFKNEKDFFHFVDQHTDLQNKITSKITDLNTGQRARSREDAFSKICEALQNNKELWGNTNLTRRRVGEIIDGLFKETVLKREKKGDIEKSFSKEEIINGVQMLWDSMRGEAEDVRIIDFFLKAGQGILVFTLPGDKMKEKDHYRRTIKKVIEGTPYEKKIWTSVAINSHFWSSK